MEIQWALVLFTVVSGAGVWLFTFSMLGYLLKKNETPSKMETLVAIILLAAGGCLSVMHLSHVDRILEALNHPTSGIFIEAAMIGVLCFLFAVYFVMLMRGTSEKMRSVIGILGMLIGVIFTYACGSSYMMESRPAWQTIALPLAYLGTAAAAGAGLNLLLKAVQKPNERTCSFAGILIVAAGILGAVLSVAFCISAAPWIMKTGSSTMGWTIALFTALAAHVSCGVVAWKKPQRTLTLGVIACAAGIIAALALRVIMWLIGTPFIDFFLMALD